MYVRVVRFTDVSAERLEGFVARVDEAGGPPAGAPVSGAKLLFDEAAGRAVALQYFDTAEDTAAGAQVLGVIDPGETPGTRASVDVRGEARALAPRAKGVLR